MLQEKLRTFRVKAGMASAKRLQKVGEELNVLQVEMDHQLQQAGKVVEFFERFFAVPVQEQVDRRLGIVCRSIQPLAEGKQVE